QLKKLQREYGEAVATVAEQKALISQLEDDLRNVNALSSMFRGDAESQRERYRLRAQELEAQTLSQQQQLTLFQNEIDKLRSDNVKLYEKIRFLQSYPSRGGTDEMAVSRYHSQYEERLDPFTTFSRKERQRRYADLKPYDKITLSMGRIIMGNKVARTFAFFYTLLLHCLVFLVLYKLAHTESCKRDMAAECHQRFAEHMYKVHGEKDFGDIGGEGHVHGGGGGHEGHVHDHLDPDNP
ncbi:hypothetical protein BaRGS_00002785, partial [Batillaria attramentaria]